MGRLVYEWDPQPKAEWLLMPYVSSEWLLISPDMGRRAAMDWRTRQLTTIQSVPGGTFVNGSTVAWRENVFILVDGPGVRGIMSWDPEHGSRPLVFDRYDTLQGAMHFATDGKDMVWTLLRRKVRPEYTGEPYDRRFLATAPFTTDPAVVASKARIVREEHDGSPDPTAKYSVGCGYAAKRSGRFDLVVTRRWCPVDRGAGAA